MFNLLLEKLKPKLSRGLSMTDGSRRRWFNTSGYYKDEPYDDPVTRHREVDNILKNILPASPRELCHPRS